jgi:hypothetical protein
MAQAPPAVVKIPTKSPQPARRALPRPASGRVRGSGTGRAAARGGGARLEKVTTRLAAGAPNMKKPGADPFYGKGPGERCATWAIL